MRHFLTGTISTTILGTVIAKASAVTTTKQLHQQAFKHLKKIGEIFV